MKVCVTGASGFIGQHLCAELLAQKYEVLTLSRSHIENQSLHSQIWDVRETLAPELLKGVEVIFHLAGKAHALTETRQDESEYFKINTEGTCKLLEAAQQAEVKRVVYFSSVKANIDEETTPYGASKAAAEKLVLEGEYIHEPVVIRPTMVYGNTEKGNLPKMIRAIAAGRFPSLPEFGNQRSMVHVNDVVHAAICMATKSEAKGQTYIVSDGEGVSTRQLYEWICDALNKPIPNWKIPLRLLEGLAKIGDIIGNLRGKRFVFDSDALNKLSSSAIYSSQKIQKELGFQAQHTLKSSLPKIIRFLDLS